MKGRLPRYLGLDEQLGLGVTIAWDPGFTHQVIWAALWDFMQQFQALGIAAWEESERACQHRAYPRLKLGPDEEGLEKQRQALFFCRRPGKVPRHLTGGNSAGSGW